MITNPSTSRNPNIAINRMRQLPGLKKLCFACCLDASPSQGHHQIADSNKRSVMVVHFELTILFSSTKWNYMNSSGVPDLLMRFFVFVSVAGEECAP